MKHRWMIFSLALALVSGVAQQPSRRDNRAPIDSAGALRLFDVKEGMKEQTVLAGLSAKHKLSKVDIGEGMVSWKVASWTVAGKDDYSNDPNEAGQITFQDGTLIYVSRWLTEGYSGEAVKFTQELFRNLWLQMPSSKDVAANRLGVRETAARLEVWQMNPLLDEQRISVTLEDGTWFTIVVGNYEKLPRFVHIERGTGRMPTAPASK